MGCTRIAHFAGSQKRAIYRDRQKGYEDALKEAGLEVDCSRVVQFDTLSAQEGKKAMRQLMQLPEPPDGLFSSNDTAAVSAIQYLKKKGIHVPKDIAVIGFNNDPIASILEPQLSTVSHPAAKMGKLAAQCVLDNMDFVAKEGQLNQVTTLETELILRASSLR